MNKLTVGLLVLLGIITPAAALAAEPSGKLVVHEWGTFTGLSTSHGEHLPFRNDIGAGLPSFVLTRLEQAQRLNPPPLHELLDIFGKDESIALQRMETPVVYFYTDAPREAEVKVDFPKGMLTEFYPPVRGMTPAFDAVAEREVLKGSSLDWGKIRIVPASSATRIPEVKDGNHYAHARATDAAAVQFSDRPGEVFEENFLFYRGLGDFRLPVVMTASGENTFTLHNRSNAALGAAFLIRITDGHLRFAVYRNVGASQRMTLPSAPSSATLADELVKALVDEGLYEKEARAMVRTWESSWFGKEGTGTRVLYTLPRRVTDELLPLRITPTPDETVRVLVGRIDILTPRQEAALASMFPRVGAQGALTPTEAREAKALGRFLVPALHHAARTQASDVYRAINTAANSN